MGVVVGLVISYLDLGEGIFALISTLVLAGFSAFCASWVVNAFGVRRKVFDAMH